MRFALRVDVIDLYFGCGAVVGCIKVGTGGFVLGLVLRSWFWLVLRCWFRRWLNWLLF